MNDSNNKSPSNWTSFDIVPDPSQTSDLNEDQSTVIINPSLLVCTNQINESSYVKFHADTDASNAHIKPIQTIHTEDYQSAFCENGDIVHTLYPDNMSCSWLTAPHFDSRNMPQIFRRENISLSDNEFYTVIEVITNDYRFRNYCTLYRRSITLWLIFAVFVLSIVLFTHENGGYPLLIFTVVWIVITISGIVVIAFVKDQIMEGLYKCVQTINKLLMEKNLLIGIDDLGQLSCHKVVIVFMYIRSTDCITDIERLIRQHSIRQKPENANIKAADVHKIAVDLYLKYSQHFVKQSSKKLWLFPKRPSHGVSVYSPKHFPLSHCMCQYIDMEHFNRENNQWYRLSA